MKIVFYKTELKYCSWFSQLSHSLSHIYNICKQVFKTYSHDLTYSFVYFFRFVFWGLIQNIWESVSVRTEQRESWLTRRRSTSRWQRYITVTWHDWSAVFFICHLRLANMCIFWNIRLGFVDGCPVNRQSHFSQCGSTYSLETAPHLPHMHFLMQEDLPLSILVHHLLLRTTIILVVLL